MKRAIYQEHDNQGEPKKRNRLSLSCSYCKKRKVKCNREQPCSSCIKFNVAQFCSYQSRVDEKSGLAQSAAMENETIGKNGILKGMSPEQEGKASRMDSRGDDDAIHKELEFLRCRMKNLENMLGSKPSTLRGASFNNIGSFPESASSTASVDYPSSAQNFSNYQERISLRADTPIVPNGSKSNNFGERTKNYRAVYLEYESLYNGINPCGVQDDYLNFHDYTAIHFKSKTKRMYLGPFSWPAIYRKDPYLSVIWDCIDARKCKEAAAEEKAKDLNAKSPLAKSAIDVINSEIRDAHLGDNDTEQERKFREKALDCEGLNDTRVYKVKDARVKSTYESNWARETLRIENFCEKNEDKLVELISTSLPKRKVIWTLIRIFFSQVYPFVPILDEIAFKEEITRILGPESSADEPVKEVKVESRIDFAHIATLLILLRLTYISLLTNSMLFDEKSTNKEQIIDRSEEIKYILLNPVSIGAISLAQCCLGQFDILRYDSFEVLQSYLFMAIYKVYAPEESDAGDGADFVLFRGLLTQMGYSIGLNLEPSKYPELFRNKKSNNLNRKVWFFLKCYDILQGSQLGNAPFIDAKYSDISEPFFSPEASNIKDIECEKRIHMSLDIQKEVHRKVKRILDVTTPVSSSVSVAYLTELISDFESKLYRTFGVLSDYCFPCKESKEPYNFCKIAFCRDYLYLRAFTLTLLFYLFLYYERIKSKELSFFYLRKIIKIIVQEIFPASYELSYNNSVNFGDTSDLILNPGFLQMMHRCILILIALLLRVNKNNQLLSNSYSADPSLAEDMDFVSKSSKMKEFLTLIERILEILIIRSSKLSGTYYFAWRSAKINGLIFKVVRGKNIYKNPTMSIFAIDNNGLDEIIQICRQAIELDKENSGEKGEKVGKTCADSHRSSARNVNETAALATNETLKGNLTLPNGMSGSWDSKSSKSSPTFESMVEQNVEIGNFWTLLALMRNNITTDTNLFDWQDLDMLERIQDPTQSDVNGKALNEIRFGTALEPANDFTTEKVMYDWNG